MYLIKNSEIKKSKISNSKIQRFFPEENQELLNQESKDSKVLKFLIQGFN